MAQRTLTVFRPSLALGFITANSAHAVSRCQTGGNFKLKTYQTSVGFFDLAIAAPSMKAAAQAWGSQIDVFRRGFAKETHDAAIVAATMARPGVVLKRPVGSDEFFSLTDNCADSEPGSTSYNIRGPCLGRSCK